MLKNSRFSLPVVLIGLLCLILISVSAVAAYYISTDNKVNSITVGENISEIVEDYDPPGKFKKGEDYTKKVTVKNTGSVDCFVRVFAEMEEPAMTAALDVDYNTTDWTVKQSDGYYYYKKVLAPGESTVPLFTTLHAKDNLNYFSMIVYEESTQAGGYTDPLQAFASYQ